MDCPFLVDVFFRFVSLFRVLSKWLDRLARFDYILCVIIWHSWFEWCPCLCKHFQRVGFERLHEHTELRFLEYRLLFTMTLSIRTFSGNSQWEYWNIVLETGFCSWKPFLSLKSYSLLFFIYYSPNISKNCFYAFQYKYIEFIEIRWQYSLTI